MPRIFFAVVTPQALKRKLEILQACLADEFSNLRPSPNVRAENLHNSHCTIKFLGDVDESNVEPIIGSVRSAFESNPVDSIAIRLCKAGVFPTRKTAKVFWIGLEPIEAFRNIRSTIDNGLWAADKRRYDDQAFHPHLTLFRFREPYNLSTNFVFPDLTDSSLSEIVTEVALIESRLSSLGAAHTIRARFPLVKPDLAKPDLAKPEA